MAYTPLIESEYNKNKAITYSDVSLTRRITSEGALKELVNEDALSQAFKIWLVSSVNEKVRTTSGGWLIPYIGKPMTEENLRLLKVSIKTGIETDFKPALTIITLEVVPIYEKQQWVIYLVGFNPDLNIGINTAVTVSNI